MRIRNVAPHTVAPTVATWLFDRVAGRHSLRASRSETGTEPHGDRRLFRNARERRHLCREIHVERLAQAVHEVRDPRIGDGVADAQTRESMDLRERAGDDEVRDYSPKLEAWRADIVGVPRKSAGPEAPGDWRLQLTAMSV